MRHSRPPSNIAEGAADRTEEPFRVLLGYVIRSLNDVGTLSEAVRRVRLVAGKDAAGISALIDEYLRLSYGLKRSL